jgi:ectoine hydroxylase-related dioxygenase (phytanoyl-CoA dioxygenase family)
MVGCLIAGSRCTYENGVSPSTCFILTLSDIYSSQATAVIPGSHLWGTDRAPKVDEVTYAEMEPGSALFTLGCEYDPAKNLFEALLSISFCSNLPWCWREQMRKGRLRRSADSVRGLWVRLHQMRHQ